MLQFQWSVISTLGARQVCSIFHRFELTFDCKLSIFCLLVIRTLPEQSSASKKKFIPFHPLHVVAKRKQCIETTKPASFVIRQSSVLDDVETDIEPLISSKKRAIVDEFVKKMGGKRTLQRILIANNGMAATKAILSMRQWAYMVLGTLMIRISFLLAVSG